MFRCCDPSAPLHPASYADSFTVLYLISHEISLCLGAVIPLLLCTLLRTQTASQFSFLSVLKAPYVLGAVIPLLLCTLLHRQTASQFSF